MSTPEQLSDQSLQAALTREQTLFTNLLSLASDRGLAWVGDERAQQISDQGTAAYVGYCAMSRAINTTAQTLMQNCEGQMITTTAMVDGKTFNQGLNAALSNWATIEEGGDGCTLDFVRTTAETHPHLDFTLVATPNLVLSPQQLIEVGKVFGEQQPTPTHIVDEQDYGDGSIPFFTLYTADELSGPLAVDSQGAFSKIRFSLIPTGSYSEDMLNRTEKLALLQELQDTFPGAKLHVPSVLTNLTRWFTLRARLGNVPLLGSNLVAETGVDHFDLEPKQYSVDISVPTTYISNEVPNFDGEYCQVNFSASRTGDGSLTTVAAG